MADFEETSAADLALRGPPRAFCVSFALCQRASMRLFTLFIPVRMYVHTYLLCVRVKVRLLA